MDLCACMGNAWKWCYHHLGKFLKPKNWRPQTTVPSTGELFVRISVKSTVSNTNTPLKTNMFIWKSPCSISDIYIYICLYIFIHVWIFQSTVGGWGKDPKSRSWSNLGVSSVVSFSHPSISLGDLCYRMAREFVAGWISLDACEFKKGAFLGGFIYYGI